jgi:hypothetical protein
MVGSIEQLGNWDRNKTKATMVWNNGHVWRTTVLIDKSSPIFEYKYVIIDGDKHQWEIGINRIADVNLMKKKD